MGGSLKKLPKKFHGLFTRHIKESENTDLNQIVKLSKNKLADRAVFDRFQKYFCEFN